MLIIDSKSSLQDVGVVTGIIGSAPVSPILGEGAERLLFAIRASFDRLFQPSRHWSPYQPVNNYQPVRFSLANQTLVNSFGAIQEAYGEAFEKLEAAKEPLKTDQRQKIRIPKNPFVQSSKGRVKSLSSEFQSLFSEADRLSRSSNPEDRVRANQAKLRAIQILHIMAQLNRQFQPNQEARWSYR